LSEPRIRVYTDEDVDVRVAEQLKRLRYDVASCRDEGNAGRRLSDDWQLGYAAEHGRAILIHNIPHYVVLDRDWKAQGREHAGIICAPMRTPLGELGRRLRRHLDAVRPADQHNLLRFLA
jgi:hypothetical protein